MANLRSLPYEATHDEKQSHTTLHAHGDGTYHTESGYGPNSRKEHKTFGAAVAHMAKHHAADDVMVIEGHEDGYRTHHVLQHDKTVRGPHDHKNMRELKRHVAETMDEDGD